MSDIDDPKITQMLDAGWTIQVYKNDMGNYTTQAKHHNEQHTEKTRERLIRLAKQSGATTEIAEDFAGDDDYILTDDRTPCKSIERMAYKVLGEVQQTEKEPDDED